MADHGMLFSLPMVLALLREIAEPDTGKTQTRRLLKPQPPSAKQFPHSVFGMSRSVADGVKMYSENDHAHIPKHPTRWDLVGCVGVARDAGFPLRYDVGFVPGDRIWVREAIYYDTAHNNFYYAADNRGVGGEICLKLWEHRARRPKARTMQPSMFMPRWASRITLTVSDVRVQRLRGISEDDARAEGIKQSPHGNGDQWLNYPAGSSAAGWLDPRESFRTLWDSLNSKPGTTWADDPWVVATTFVPELRNIDASDVADAV